MYLDLVKSTYSLPLREIEITEKKRFLSIKDLWTAIKQFFNTISFRMQRNKP